MGLKNKFEGVVAEYISSFCEKHEIDFDYWVADQIGTVASFGDYFFSLEDIRLDIDYDIPKEHLFAWYEKVVSTSTPDYRLTYYAYLSNLPASGVEKRLAVATKSINH